MVRTPLLAIVLAGVFAVSTSGAYAQQDDKKDESPYPKLIAQSDDKEDTKKPELITQQDDRKDESPYPKLIAQSDEKDEAKKPELVG